MSKRPRTALVIGGGIAGPVLALALQRVGMEVIVYEAYDTPADYTGWFLNLASNGLEVLGTLGIDLREADGFPMSRLVMWNGRGKRLGEVVNGLRPEDGPVSLCVKRGVLQRVLRDEAVRRGVKMVYGKRLEHYNVKAGHVCTAFADGSDAEGDLLIGADGVHSRTRALISPANPQPAYTGLLSIGGYAHAKDVPLPATPDTQHFIFGRRAFFGYLVRRTGEIYWFANLGQPEEPGAGALRQLPASYWREKLCTLFETDQPFIREMIASSETMGANAIYDMPHVPRWHEGPVGLIGDALHATSPSAGQGASLALEDALVMAQCLRDLPTAEDAFTAFESLRRARTERVVAYARRNGGGKAVTTPVGRWVRDVTLPVVFKLFANPKALEWLYTYSIDWETKVAVARR